MKYIYRKTIPFLFAVLAMFGSDFGAMGFGKVLGGIFGGIGRAIRRRRLRRGKKILIPGLFPEETANNYVEPSFGNSGAPLGSLGGDTKSGGADSGNPGGGVGWFGKLVEKAKKLWYVTAGLGILVFTMFRDLVLTKNKRKRWFFGK